MIGARFRLALAAVFGAALLVPQSSAQAAPIFDDVALNGVYAVVSDGQWTKTNYRFRDEETVRQTWTIASSCTTFQDCTGQVSSDLGWSAEAVYLSGRWRVKHTVADWMRCEDGTTAPGEQSFEFWRPRTDVGPELLHGWDRTTGPSRACGVNRWLNIQMPLRLDKIG